jgi:alcohol dehydrogenase
MKAVVLVAMYEKDQTLPLPNIYGKNLTIKFGGVDGYDCDKIMKYIEEKKIDATSLITHRMKFKDIMEAYEIFENKRDGVIKIAIDMKE